jgi:hypothetical protein
VAPGTADDLKKLKTLGAAFFEGQERSWRTGRFLSGIIVRMGGADPRRDQEGRAVVAILIRCGKCHVAFASADGFIAHPCCAIAGNGS